VSYQLLQIPNIHLSVFNCKATANSMGSNLDACQIAELFVNPVNALDT
jgi:hypothetical protein